MIASNEWYQNSFFRNSSSKISTGGSFSISNRLFRYIWRKRRIMKRSGLIFGIMIAVLLSSLAAAQAQTQGAQTAAVADSKRLTRVLVTGDSVVNAQPDTAILVISVVTQAKKAIDAQQENAMKSDAVMRAVKAAVAGAEVKTSGYSVQPQRVYRENMPPTITGYEARNTITVTLSDLAKVGTVIDASSQAGANDIGAISFTLRQDRQARDQALKDATREAVSKAQVIAQALGGRVVRIVEVQEEGFRQPPQPMFQMEGFIASAKRDVATPIEVGTLEISSRVQLIAEVESIL
jgi:uncharacterized protein